MRSYTIWVAHERPPVGICPACNGVLDDTGCRRDGTYPVSGGPFVTLVMGTCRGELAPDLTLMTPEERASLWERAVHEQARRRLRSIADGNG